MRVYITDYIFYFLQFLSIQFRLFASKLMRKWYSTVCHSIYLNFVQFPIFLFLFRWNGLRRHSEVVSFTSLQNSKIKIWFGNKKYRRNQRRNICLWLWSFNNLVFDFLSSAKKYFYLSIFHLFLPNHLHACVCIKQIQPIFKLNISKKGNVKGFAVQTVIGQ